MNVVRRVALETVLAGTVGEYGCPRLIEMSLSRILWPQLQLCVGDRGAVAARPDCSGEDMAVSNGGADRSAGSVRRAEPVVQGWNATARGASRGWSGCAQSEIDNLRGRWRLRPLNRGRGPIATAGHGCAEEEGSQDGD